MSYLPQIIITALAAVAIFLILRRIYLYIFVSYHLLPVKKWGFTNIPAIPFSIEKTLAYLIVLNQRSYASKQAKLGLSNKETIKGITTSGYEFLYGDNSDLINQSHVDSISSKLNKAARSMVFSKKLGLNNILKEHINISRDDPDRLTRNDITLQDIFFEHPNQYRVAITNYHDIYNKNIAKLIPWEKTLTNVDIANELFWTMIEQHSAAFNSQVIFKVTLDKIPELKEQYGDAWTDELSAYSKKGILYAIDMRIFSSFKHSDINDHPRFTPSTFTLLKQDPSSKKLTPFSIWVSNYNDEIKEQYTYGCCTDGAWLYALQAAKVSITNFHIWIDHAYRLHLVPAVFQMSLYKNLPEDHQVYKLLNPISKHLIEFDTILIFLWDTIGLPTSFSSPFQYLELVNTFAKDHSIFDDDPLTSLSRRNISKDSFSFQEDWDRYGIAKHQITIWEIVQKYVHRFVEAAYPNDQSVIDDKQLQKWIDDCKDPKIGNLKGIPILNSKKNLEKILTSYINRITYHGGARQIDTLQPALMYPGHTPCCLQRLDLPSPHKEINTKELLSFLPNTGTVGETFNFFGIFSFSPPAESLIPAGGIQEELYFNEDALDPRNVALIEFRKDMIKYMDSTFDNPIYFQWPLTSES